MSLHRSTVTMFYRPEMAPSGVASFSKSPTKPRRFMEFLPRTPLWAHVKQERLFPRVTREQLLTAHTREYVEAYLDGHEPLASSCGIDWTPEQRDSVLFTNGALVSAVMHALAHPEEITMAPVSGLHHARPERGEGFCTFSGQVIAGVEAWRRRGVHGAWIDLDQHFGNSIEDARDFRVGQVEPIPEGCNLNINATHKEYLAELSVKLTQLGERVLSGEIHYVGVAHGADSHEWDSLGGAVTTEEWVSAAAMVYDRIRAWSARLGRPVPVVMALFGGYRDDDPDSVLGLHAMDLAQALHWLGGNNLVGYRAPVQPRGRMR